jgi:hypothetical protein
MTTVYVSPINGDDNNDGLSEQGPVRTIARARAIAINTNAEDIRVFDGAFSSRLRVELEKETKKKRRSAKARITASD